MNKLSSTVRKVYEFEHRINLWRRRASLRRGLTAIAERALRILSAEQIEGFFSMLIAKSRR